MSFFLYQSNRLETLAGLFQQKLYETGAEIFTPVSTVVANGGMKAFLQHYIASRTAVAANLQCRFLRDFITQSICCFLMPEEQEQWRKSEELFSSSILSWRINRLLTEHPEDFPEWNSYFSSGKAEDREKRCFELSAKLAELFDDYSLYCHEKLIAWKEGKIEEHPFGGQQKLYQALIAKSKIPGREYFFDRFLKGENLQSPQGLPADVGVFGIGCMPELYLKILVKLSEYCDIHFFCPMPSREYSGVEPQSRKEKIEAILNGEESFEHPLISDLGRSGTVFLNALLDNNCFSGEEVPCFSETPSETGNPTMLQQFQWDLLNQNRHKNPLEFPAEDDSIMIHSCHTVRRELEVLHDRLVQIFKKGSYTPEDVIVMFPDINRYAPVIEAVFDNGPFAGKFSVCDRTQLASSPAVICFRRLLKLCDSRFTAQEIMELLEFPALMSRFNLGFSDFTELNKIILESGIHWGYNSETHEKFCKVNFPEYTFQDGFDRQLEKFARGETGFTRADLLGRFMEAVNAFGKLSRELTESRTPEEWSDFLQKEVLERFFDSRNPDYADELLALREAIIKFGVSAKKAEFTKEIHIAAVTAALDFSGTIGQQKFLRGKMTFCSLEPLRTVPAKIIAVLGLNSEDFPPADSRDELNFLIKAKIHGVPSKAADSRYLLLETLMAAREKLILSYLGQSSEKEEELEPAAPLAAILQVLKQTYRYKPRSPQEKDKEKCECKAKKFPLQSVLLDETAAVPVQECPGRELYEPEKLEVLNIRSLCEILLNPVNAWWKAHWKEEAEKPENNTAADDEPIAVDPLLNSNLNRRLFDLTLQNLSPEECEAKLRAERLLPLGGIGRESFESAWQQQIAVPEDLRKILLPEHKKSRSLEFCGENGMILSDNGPFYDAGAVKLCFSSPRAAKMFSCYIEQLLRCACGEECGYDVCFVKDSESKRYTAKAFSKEEAAEKLNDLLNLAQEARENILPLFSNASSAYAEAYNDTDPKKQEKAWQNAEKAFENSYDFYADIKNIVVKTLFSSWKKVQEQGSEFEKLALRLYAPLCKIKPERHKLELAEQAPCENNEQPPEPSVPARKTVPQSAPDRSRICASPWTEVSCKGYAILEAAAGTGKTHNLKNIFARILLERPEIEIENIVVVTFTKAAAGELRSRIRERLTALARWDENDEEVPKFAELSGLPPEKISKIARKALLKFDNAPIGTIHSFAQRVLGDHGFGSQMRFNFQIKENSSETLKLYLNDFYRTLRYSDPEKVPDALWTEFSLEKLTKAVSFYFANPECVPENFPALDSGVSQLELPRLKQAVTGAALNWCKERMLAYKEQENVLSYDDLIFELQKALKEHPELKKLLQKEYKVGLIDEFQDTDRKQFEIFKDLFIDNPEGTLIVVGDPRQAIYRFRSGDIDTYFAACKLLQSKGAPVFQMNCNRRSTPDLIAGFNAVFAGDPTAFARLGMTLPEQTALDDSTAGLLDENGEVFKFKVQKPQLDDNGNVFTVETEQVLALSAFYTSGNADSGIKCCAKEIAAMCKRKLYLPPKNKDDKKIRLVPEHFAVLVSSWAKGNKMKEELKKYRIPAVCIRGENVYTSDEALTLLELLECITAPELPSARYRAQSALGVFDGKLVEITAEICASLRDLWLKNSFIAMFNKLTEKMQIIDRFAVLDDGDRRIANWYQLGDLLYESCSKNQLTPGAAVSLLRREISNPSNDESKRAIRETDHGAVVIDTVFGSKGLAYPVVFLPELFDVGDSLNSNKLSGKYHDDNGILRYNPDGGETLQKREKNEIIQENLRKFYVALTRAQYYCCFATGEPRSKKSAVDWLFRKTKEEKECLLKAPPESPLLDKEKGKVEFPDQLACPYFSKNVENCQLDSGKKPDWRKADHSTWIPEGRTFLSFSGLVQHDGEQFNARFRNEHSDEGISLLPGGTIFGNAVHRILELTPFNTSKEKLEQLTQYVMTKFGFGEASYQKEVTEMVSHILTAPIPGAEGNFCLADIPAEKRMAEFEFLFQTENQFSRTKVLQAAFDYFDAKFPTSDPERVDHGNINFEGAFFNGFIDLFFEHQGKFYIVDWKTNKLGDKFEDYNAAGTAAAMRSNGYCLQYLLYTAALMKYLSYRMKKELNQEFYDEIFGGVRYIFTRGISPAHPGCGVFRDRPAWNELKIFLELIAK